MFINPELYSLEPSAKPMNTLASVAHGRSAQESFLLLGFSTSCTLFGGESYIPGMTHSKRE